MIERAKEHSRNFNKYDTKRNAKYSVFETLPNLNQQALKREEESFRVGEANSFMQRRMEDERFKKKILDREALKK